MNIKRNINRREKGSQGSASKSISKPGAPTGARILRRRTLEEAGKAKAKLLKRRKEKRFLRNMEALDLRTKGLSYHKIAEHFDTFPMTAKRYVDQALKSLDSDSKEDQEQVVQLETQRMDSLLEGMWEAATKGYYGYNKKGDKIFFPPSAKHADAVMKIMKRRADMLGLDKPKTTLLGNDPEHPLIENVEAKLIDTLTRLAKNSQRGKDDQLEESEITAMEEMVPIQSTNIKRAGYNEETEVLTVIFKTGKKYEYLDVPSNVWDGLLEAKSPGSYFHKAIRTKYEHMKVK